MSVHSRPLPVIARIAALAFVFVFMLASCGKEAAPAAGGGNPAAAMPPPEVGVVTVKPGAVGLVTELPGRLEASRVAQVRARVAGIVLKREFREGSEVRAGQPLFRIDPAAYKATVASAQANVARAEATLGTAKALAERYKPLVEANAISKQDYANAVAAEKQAQADVAAQRATLQTAQINLGYADVTAPISGRIGRALVTEGALVGQGEVTPLALIQQTNPMYVNFTQSATDVLKLRQALAQGKLQRAGGEEGVLVHLILEDGTEYPTAGKLLFSDLTVDQNTGQITLRAQVPNPKGLLLPGMYVRVRLEQAKAAQAVLLPQQAVSRSTQGDTVMVVGGDGKVAVQPVQLGSAQGNDWVVLGGLKPGQQVIVDGLQKVRPGAPVKPVPWQPAPAAGASAPAPTKS
jgi:membrane fusion protein, multidrug efflux system